MRLILKHLLSAMILFVALPNAAAAPAPLTLKFDYAAVDGFLRAVDREPGDAAQWREIAHGHGADAMVRNTIKYVPDSPAEGYVASLRELAATGKLATDPYGLGDAVANSAGIKTFMAAIRKAERGMESRIAARLVPYMKQSDPFAITVHLVIGGASDGFVIDGSTAPEFFIAIDKAGGDIAGLEQNITHESVHVLQRQLALQHCPEAPSIEKRPPLARFLATTYEEGVANYLADPMTVTGEGEYIQMWRDRYARNATPERQRENAYLFRVLRDGLKQGELTWDTAYQFGFYGNLDSRMYFHGRELARRFERAGVDALSDDFSCNPERFFEDSSKLPKPR